MLGSAMATLASYFVMAMVIYRYSTQSFAVPYKLWQGFAVVGVTAISLYIKSFLSERFFSDIISSIIVLIIGLGIIVALSFGNHIRAKRVS